MASRVAAAASNPLCRVMVSPRVTTLTDVNASTISLISTPSNLAATTTRTQFNVLFIRQASLIVLITYFDLVDIGYSASIRVVISWAGWNQIHVTQMNDSCQD